METDFFVLIVLKNLDISFKMQGNYELPSNLVCSNKLKLRKGKKTSKDGMTLETT